MLKLNSELRAQAREALRGKWPMAAVAALIYSEEFYKLKYCSTVVYMVPRA